MTNVQVCLVILKALVPNYYYITNSTNNYQYITNSRIVRTHFSSIVALNN